MTSFARFYFFLGSGPERAAHQCEKLARPVRLFEHRERAARCGAAAGRGVGVSADDDDRQGVAAAAQVRQNLNAIHPRHGEVEEQAIANGRAHRIEKPPAGGKYSLPGSRKVGSGPLVSIERARARVVP
jgi:hypothetical protein